MSNSFVLYKKGESMLSQLGYRHDLIEKLISAYHNESQRSKVGRRSDNEATWLTACHFVSFIPPTANNKLPTWRCVVCCEASSAGETKIHKETRYWCKDCNVAVCMTPCFKIYHTKTNFWALSTSNFDTRQVAKCQEKKPFVVQLIHICKIKVLSPRNML